MLTTMPRAIAGGAVSLGILHPFACHLVTHLMGSRRTQHGKRAQNWAIPERNDCIFSAG